MMVALFSDKSSGKNSREQKLLKQFVYDILRANENVESECNAYYNFPDGMQTCFGECHEEANCQYDCSEEVHFCGINEESGVAVAEGEKYLEIFCSEQQCYYG